MHRIPEAARRRQARRTRRAEDLDLAACLQFRGKRDVLLSVGTLSEVAGLPSRRAAKRVFVGLEDLRNQVAHAHAIDTRRWPEVAALLPVAERFVERAERRGFAGRPVRPSPRSLASQTSR